MGSGGNQASVKTYIAIADEQLPHNLGPADGILGLAFNALNSASTSRPTSPAERQPAGHLPVALPVKTSAAALQQVEQFLARLTEIDLTPYFTALEDAEVTRNIFAFYTLRSTPSMASADAPETDPLNNGIFVLGGGLDQTDLYTGQPLNVAVLDDLYYNTNLKAVQVGDAGAGGSGAAAPGPGEDADFKLDRRQWH